MRRFALAATLSLAVALMVGLAATAGATCPGACDPNPVTNVQAGCCNADCTFKATNASCIDYVDGDPLDPNNPVYENECTTNTKCDSTHQCQAGTNVDIDCQNPNDRCERGHCHSKQCQGPFGNWCDDGNPCTNDPCTLDDPPTCPNGACCGPYTDLPANTDCNTDDNRCTQEYCQGTNPAHCDPDPSNRSPNTVNCNGMTGVCTVICADTNPGQCAIDFCDPAQLCIVVAAPINTPCPDTTPLDCHDSLCNGNDTGTAGCTRTPVSNPGVVCDKDGNPCSRGTCAGPPSAQCQGEGQFTQPNPPVSCAADSNPCTLDQCESGSTNCMHPNTASGVSCPADSTICTLDACDGNGTCAHTPTLEGQSCNDNNVCTASSTCQSGACTGTSCNTGVCSSGSCGTSYCNSTLPKCGCFP